MRLVHIKITMTREHYVARAADYGTEYGMSPDEAIGAMVRAIWLGQSGSGIISVTLEMHTDEYTEEEED